MSLVRNRSGGGGGGTVTTGPYEYLEVANETKQLTKDDQHVLITSDTANTIVTLPQKTQVNDGHPIEFVRGEGTFPQTVFSIDASVSLPPDISASPELQLPLNGNATDESSNAFTVSQSSNTSFVSDNVFGQTHDVLQIESGAGDFDGLFVDGESVGFEDATWTIYGQFKSDGSTPATNSGIFTIGDPTQQGSAISFIFVDSNKVKLFLGLDSSGTEMSVEYDTLAPTLLSAGYHTIALTSSSRGAGDLNLYIDDMETPVAKSRINGGRGVYVEGAGFSIGHSTHTSVSNAAVKGRYSNWQVYKKTLGTESLRLLKSNGLFRAGLSFLTRNDTLRVIYNAAENKWKAADAKALKLLKHSDEIQALQNPPLGPTIRAVSNTTQTVSSDAAGDTVLFEVEKSSVNMTLVNGELEFSEGGIYTILVSLNLSLSGFTGNIETWVEIYDPSTTSWLTVDDSGKIKEFDSVNEGNVYYNSVFEVIAGTKLRLRARTSAFGITLVSQTLSNGVAAPSTTLSVSKV